MVRNTMELAQKANKVINKNYDIYGKNIMEITSESNNSVDMVVNGFRFGYMQGYKAAKAEMKKTTA